MYIPLNANAFLSMNESNRMKKSAHDGITQYQNNEFAADFFLSRICNSTTTGRNASAEWEI